jgi:translation elongation factor EF-1beta
MTDDTPLNPPDVPLDELGRELTGDQPEGDQVAYVRDDEIDVSELMTDTEIYEGELDRAAEGALESLTDVDLRPGETTDPNVAAEEGLTWIAPIDPPVIPSDDDPDGLEIAAGFGASAMDEPFDDDHRSEEVADEDEMSARVREALRADAATSRYADEIAIGTIAGRVALRGVLDDIEDTDNVLEVASRVAGVVEVVDELDVRALE